MKRSVQEYLSSKSVSEPNSGCWLWLGSRLPKGYGYFTLNGIREYAHRASYEALVGPIPDGLHIDHLCANTSCINPQHLEPVTLRENNLRANGFGGVNARKTHCIRGHAYTEENTYYKQGASGMQRSCLTCRKLRPGKYRNTVGVNFTDDQMNGLRRIANGGKLSLAIRALVEQALAAS